MISAAKIQPTRRSLKLRFQVAGQCKSLAPNERCSKTRNVIPFWWVDQDSITGDSNPQLPDNMS
jgi:hypothetical protein